jgi:prepilin-type N-terminal cleavage/methylation domain-containing protein
MDGANMNAGRKRAAFTLVELLVVMAVLAILAGLLFPVLAGAKRRGREPSEIARLRGLYLGLSMYDEDAEDMPPALPASLPYVRDVRMFATAYPVRTRTLSGAYPDAVFAWVSGLTVPYPVDFGYLRTYPPYHEDRHRWRERRENPVCGLIASPWAGVPSGSLGPGAPSDRFSGDVTHGPVMRGPVLRVRMDGSLYRLARNPDGGAGGVGGLFYVPHVMK